MMMMMMMLILFSFFSLTFQTAFGAEPLASISRPFHFYLPFLNTPDLVIISTKEQIPLSTPQLYIYPFINKVPVINILFDYIYAHVLNGQ